MRHRIRLRRVVGMRLQDPDGGLIVAAQEGANTVLGRRLGRGWCRDSRQHAHEEGKADGRIRAIEQTGASVDDARSGILQVPEPGDRHDSSRRLQIWPPPSDGTCAITPWEPDRRS